MVLLFAIYGFAKKVSRGGPRHIYAELQWSSLLRELTDRQTHTHNLNHFLCKHREENESK